MENPNASGVANAHEKGQVPSVGSGPLLGGSGQNAPERQKDWQTEIHDSEVFLLFQGQQAGILFPAPGFEMWHINHAVATLNAYFPTSPAKR